jgi:hypothetical protein
MFVDDYWLDCHHGLVGLMDDSIAALNLVNKKMCCFDIAVLLQTNSQSWLWNWKDNRERNKQGL